MSSTPTSRLPAAKTVALDANGNIVYSEAIPQPANGGFGSYVPRPNRSRAGVTLRALAALPSSGIADALIVKPDAIWIAAVIAPPNMPASGYDVIRINPRTLRRKALRFSRAPRPAHPFHSSRRGSGGWERVENQGTLTRVCLDR
jgi:hypothetical protein